MKILILFALIAGTFAYPRFSPVKNDDGKVLIFDSNPIELEQEPEPRFNADSDVHFLLFTQRNRNSAQRLTTAASVRNSQFSASQGVRFIIHGFNSDRNTAMNTFMRNEFLNLANLNVIVVCWGPGAQTPNYLTARNRIGEVGRVVAQFSDMLVQENLSAYSRIIVVGHSLGAHVSGMAGKRTARGRYDAIFGTDPAGPLFSVGDSANRLHTTDAVYTEAIHTNIGVLGFTDRITHAAFYPNWGASQPGCGVDAVGTCAHERSNLFYSESIRSNRFVGRLCTGMAQITNRQRCTGATGVMGGNARKSLNGIYWLETNSNSPFARG